jgi:hypothetical protein
MVFDPSREKEAIGPDEPEVKWCVSGIGRYNALHEPIPDSILHKELSAAIESAKEWSYGDDGTVSLIWSYPHPEGERQAIAVAIGGELYLKRDVLLKRPEVYGGVLDEPQDPAPLTLEGFTTDEIKSLLIMLVARIPTLRELSALAALMGAVSAVIDRDVVTTPGDVARLALYHGDALVTALEGASE